MKNKNNFMRDKNNKNKNRKNCNLYKYHNLFKGLILKIRRKEKNESRINRAILKKT